jgi:hypothetical protein
MLVTNLSAVDLNLLPLLDALLQERHLTRAARRVGLSQPAASRALSRLRALLGDPVLVRSGASFTLTSRAEALREPVRNALGIVEAAIARERLRSGKSSTNRPIIGRFIRGWLPVHGFERTPVRPPDPYPHAVSTCALRVGRTVGRTGGFVDDALAALGKEREVALMLPHALVMPFAIAASDLVVTMAERVARIYAGMLQ